LAALAAQGWVTADSFEGLRALLVSPEKRVPFAAAAHRRHHKAVTSLEFAGRWSLLRNADFQVRNADFQSAVSPISNRQISLQPSATLNSNPHDKPIGTLAHALLHRYGVVFRRLLERESFGVSWYELDRFYRRLEARGEIRGGYFVSGVSGEQFALPGAIGLLRSLRKSPAAGQLLVISAADPLNLTSILIPGRRVSAVSSNRLMLRDGVPIAALEADQFIRLDAQVSGPDRLLEPALRVGSLPAALRPYYA